MVAERTDPPVSFADSPLSQGGRGAADSPGFSQGACRLAGLRRGARGAAPYLYGRAGGNINLDPRRSAAREAAYHPPVFSSGVSRPGSPGGFFFSSATPGPPAPARSGPRTLVWLFFVRKFGAEAAVCVLHQLVVHKLRAALGHRPSSMIISSMSCRNLMPYSNAVRPFFHGQHAQPELPQLADKPRRGGVAADRSLSGFLFLISS